MATSDHSRSAPAIPAGSALTRRVPSYMLPKQPSYRQAQLLNKKNNNQASRSTHSRPEISKEETDLVEGEKEEQPSLPQVVPPKSIIDAKADISKVTLGRLFTDGGLEEILIKVFDHIHPRRVWRSLRVCKNTNTVMVKTSSIQGYLRQHLYGFGRLPIPERYRPKQSEIDEFRAKGGITGKETADWLIGMQRRLEHSTYTKVHDKPTRLPMRTLEDMRGSELLLSQGSVWTVTANPDMYPVLVRDSSRSVLTLCSEDDLVVESRCQTSSLYDIPVRHFQAKFSCTQSVADDSTTAPKHPDAVEQTFQIYLSDPPSGDSKEISVRVRLYPGGMMGALIGDHACGSTCSDEQSTRLLIIDWHKACLLGAICLFDSTARILDFQFISDKRIACTTIRAIDGHIYPCIDIYDLFKDDLAAAQSRVDACGDQRLPNIFCVASFRLPRLKATRPGCVWSEPLTSLISKSDIKVPNPSEVTAINDQVMTFRLEGQVDGESEKLQGVILLSRFRCIMLAAFSEQLEVLEAEPVGNQPPHHTSETGNTTNTSPKNVVLRTIEWDAWSSAVSIQHSTSSTVLQPNCTRTVNLARSRKDKTCAVLMIRDYNQHTLLASPETLYRDIGHPNGARFKHEEHMVMDGFRPVVKTKSIKSILFGQTLEYGLGHRLRMVDIGRYAPSTVSSRVYWDGDSVNIFAKVHNEIHMYAFRCKYRPDRPVAKAAEGKGAAS